MNKTIETEYLELLSQSNLSVAVYLINGIKLSGIIVKSDDSVILLRDSKGASEQLIYKHAISTIVPKNVV